MTRDEIIRMAIEAELFAVPYPHPTNSKEVERFAALIAAAEREACAQLCDAEGDEWDSDGVVTEKNYAAHCATVIRARGNQ